MDWRWSLVCLLAVGCMVAEDGGLAGDSVMDDDLPPWSCMDDSGGSTGACETSGGAAAPACVGTSDCPGGQVCAATFDGEIGQFECALVCVQNDDDAQWCFDDDACCDTNATCVRGLCLPGGDTSTTSGVDSSTGDASSSGVDSSSTSTDTSTGSTG